MRLKILVLFSAIVLSIGAAISVLLVMQFGAAEHSDKELQASAQRAVQLARLQWQADQLQREVWLAARADEAWVRGVFSLGTGQARGDAATDAANRLLDASVVAGDRSSQPTLSLFVDRDGIAIGRNSVALMRGDPIAARYPSQWRQLQNGLPASAVWFSAERQEQWFVSMVPVSAATGEWLGALAVGVPLNDEALVRVSEQTLGLPLWAVAIDAQGAHLLSRTRSTLELPLDAALASWLGAEGQQSAAPATRLLGKSAALAAAPLDAHTGRVALIAAAPARAVGTPGRLLWSVWAVVGVGLLLVVASAILLAAYYSRPIGELEEGLLQLINGERELRFDSDHPELGGIAARINLLLDTLLGSAPEASAEYNSDALVEPEAPAPAEPGSRAV